VTLSRHSYVIITARLLLRNINTVSISRYIWQYCMLIIFEETNIYCFRKTLCCVQLRGLSTGYFASPSHPHPPPTGHTVSWQDIGLITFHSVYPLATPHFHSSFPLRWTFSLITNTVTKYEGWNLNSGNYLFTTDTK